MKHWAIGALIGVMGATPAHALFGDDEARKAIVDLRGRFNEQNRQSAAQLEALNKQVLELNARMDQTSKGQLETQTQIELLRQDIARLRGLLETQMNAFNAELARTQKRQSDMMAEIDARLKRFEPMQVQHDGATIVVEPAEKRLFDSALARFRGGDFRLAQNEFSQLLALYPNSGYAPAALFWLGSSQYAQKDARGAIVSQQTLITRFPDSPRIPDAMLNLGIAQIDAGDKRAARSTFQAIIEKYPETQAAQPARERLSTLR